ERLVAARAARPADHAGEPHVERGRDVRRSLADHQARLVAEVCRDEQAILAALHGEFAAVLAAQANATHRAARIAHGERERAVLVGPADSEGGEARLAHAELGGELQALAVAER